MVLGRFGGGSGTKTLDQSQRKKKPWLRASLLSRLYPGGTATLTGGSRKGRGGNSVNINQLVKEVHENAKAKGWWNEERSFGDIVPLIHSEATNRVRIVTEEVIRNAMRID